MRKFRFCKVVSTSNRAVFWLAVLAAFAGAILARAQADSATTTTPVEITAKKTEYGNNNKLWVLTGDVLVKHGETQLWADRVNYDTETQDVRGHGNVRILHEGREYTGENFTYNLSTAEGDWMSLEGLLGAFLVTSESMTMVGDKEFLLQDATITTCQAESPEVYLRAREARVVEDEYVEAWGVLLYVKDVPVFYFPRVKKRLDAEHSNLSVVPGYSSRWGGFLLTSYRYTMAPWLDGKTRLDYRSARGLGVGQDLYWRDRSEETFEGELRVYSADDDMPFEDVLDRQQTDELVDSGRYRLKLRHQHTLPNEDVIRINSDYLSDPDVLEDFFDREFRLNRVPENFATWTRRDARYTAAVDFNFRANDFYSNSDRLPEAMLDIPRVQISGTQFYYESNNSIGYLQNSFADQLAEPDVGSGRINTRHLFTFYTKQLGWLNLSPRAGYQGTYYSETPRLRSILSGIATNEAGEATGGTGAIETVPGGGREFRNVFELGLEASFKSFKELSTRDRGQDSGLRHVVEPFVNYTYLPEPNVTPDELYQFDRIDAVDERNDLGFGLRNKLQTRRNNRLHDLAYLELLTVANVSKAADETDTFEDLFFDAEFRIFERGALDVRGNYDFANDRLDEVVVDVGFAARQLTSLNLSYLFRKDSRELVAGELNLFPRERWSYKGYARYDLRDSDLQEHSHFVRRKFDCLGLGLGVREVGSDISVWAQVWLLAFPGSTVDLGR